MSVVDAPWDGISPTHQLRDGQGLRSMENLLDIAVLENATIIDERQSRCSISRLPAIVCDEHDGHRKLAVQLPEKCVHVVAQTLIERAERFVEQQCARARDQRSCERNPLLLPARDLVRATHSETIESDEVKE